MQAINKIILGTVQFGLDYGINNISGKPNQEQVNEILYTAYKGGIRILDTADGYGNAHQVIGAFHKAHPDNVFEIITKLPHNINDNIEEKIQSYLNELNVSELAGLLFHSYKTYKGNRDLVASLVNYKSSGKVKDIGVSIYTNEEMDDVINDENIDVIQMPFNVFDNINLRKDVLERAKDKGKTIYSRSAFLQGLFFTSLNSNSKLIQDLKDELQDLHRISSEYSLSVRQIALNYCLQQPNIDKVLIGVDNLGQLNQNLVDAEYVVPTDLLEKINAIHIKDIELLNPSLWNQ